MRIAAFLALLVPVTVCAQGVATRSVKPTPRGKPSGLPFHARFVDVAAETGLTKPVIYGGIRSKSYILETTGCGAALVDLDADGWLDVLLLTGSRLPEDPDKPAEEATLRLYRNQRDGTFKDVTETSGLGRGGWASSVTAGDYDNDGDVDLFVTFWGQNALFRNEGGGAFSEQTKEAGLLEEATRWGSGAAFFDYDRDGDLDLFVANYLVFDMKRIPRPGENNTCMWKGVPVNCGPRGLPPGRHSLHRNEGNGKFTDVTAPSGVGKAAGSYAMTVAAADFDNDGWTDIYVACDSTPSFLFINKHDGTFAETGLERGVALNEDGMEQAGMGLGIGDFNLDGSLDIFKTHFSDDTSILYRNDGKGNFDDVTIPAGIGVETRFVGWGAGMADLDNDGNPDLMLVTGAVYPEVELKLPAYPFRTPRVVFRSLGGGKFEELIEAAGPGIAAAHPSRGAAFGDYDNDGDVDVLVVNLNEPPSLLRNDLKGGGNWLKVQLTGTKSNRLAIGARVTAFYGGKKQAQEVLSQASFYSLNDLRPHFGLGAATEADLEIRWPNGTVERVEKVAANRIVQVREGSGLVKEPAPSR